MSSLPDPIALNLQNWDERAAIHARDQTDAYRLARFRAGDDALHTIETEELGIVVGKRILHLQCHIGPDTLSLARRGAIVTGLDFSRVAISFARQLAADTGIAATFVHGTVEEAPLLAPGPFDLVFTTWGTVCWLPDMRAWARTIAAVLVPGGELYLADMHPGFSLLDEREGRIVPVFDFDTPPDSPLEFAAETTYTGDATPLTNSATREWIHSLSSIFGALIEAGLTITMFREHEVLPWQGLPSLVPATDRLLAAAGRASASAAGLLAAGTEKRVGGCGPPGLDLRGWRR